MSLEKSLVRLKLDRLDSLLLHHPADLLEWRGERIYRSLLGLKKSGLVERIGVSIYSPNELDTILDNYDIDIVQAPFNVLDRRLETSGCLTRLHELGIEVHVRSVFLQGLLLLKKSEMPDRFHRWDGVWNLWHDWLKDNNITALSATLNFALSEKKHRPGCNRCSGYFTTRPNYRFDRT